MRKFLDKINIYSTKIMNEVEYFDDEQINFKYVILCEFFLIDEVGIRLISRTATCVYHCK